MSITARLFAATLLGVALFSVPLFTQAMGKMADEMCNPVLPVCPCGQIMKGTPPKCTMVGPQANKFMCPAICWDITAGHKTVGTCIAPNLCQGQTADGKGVDQGLQQLAQQLGQMLQQLMKGGQGGEQPQQQPQTGTTGTGCTQLIQVRDIESLQGNPCAQYSPLGSDSILGNLGSDVFSSLDLGTPTNVSDIINTNTNTNTNTNAGTNIGSIASGSNTSNTTKSSSTPVIVTATGVSSAGKVVYAGTSTGGLTPTSTMSGDIRTGGAGVTVTGSLRDLQSNTEVAGFVGAKTFSSQVKGFVAGMCQSRPWAANFLSRIIPPSFFDDLCASRGYLVGPQPQPQAPTQTETQAPPQVTLKQTPAKATSSPATTTNTVRPRVDIWALPAVVPIGARTSVFWSTQGVVSCTESSPSGNFNQATLSGGAATVPLAEATVFTITCIAPDGTEHKDSVTVNLAI